MIILLSPSKSQDFLSPAPALPVTQPEFLKEAETLVKCLRKYSVPQLEKMMSISTKLAELNHARYKAFQLPFSEANARAALLAFTGDVYDGFSLNSYKKADFLFAQQHLRILSGMYGLLRPLDLIQPYRLEMKTPLASAKAEDLYDFWAEKLTNAINNAINTAAKDSSARAIINLASIEYFGAISAKKLCVPLITPHFKEKKGKEIKIIGLFAKKARGLMADYAIRHRITNPEALKSFDAEGYHFTDKFSDASNWVFVR